VSAIKEERRMNKRRGRGSGKILDNEAIEGKQFIIY